MVRSKPRSARSPEESPLVKKLQKAVLQYRHHLDRGRQRLWVAFFADYRDKATWRKLEGAFEVQFPGCRVASVAVGEYNTIEAGVHVLEYAYSPQSYRPPTMVICTNVAPIRHTHKSAKRSDRLVLALLENGMLVFSYLNGEELNFVAEHIAALFVLESDDKHVDFRSRDIMPVIISRILHGDFSPIVDAVGPREIAKFGIAAGNRWRVGWIDEPYDNIKTPICEDDPALRRRKDGSTLDIRIGHVMLPVRLHRSIAALRDGELGLVRSSDSEVRDSKKVHHMVLAVKGSHAWGVFLRPPIGTPIEIID